jgi:hypothetical protein
MSMAPSILVGVKWKQLKTEVGGQRSEVGQERKSGSRGPRGGKKPKYEFNTKRNERTQYE